MQPLEYQKLTASERRDVIVKIARAFAGLSKKKFPKIHSEIESGNMAKERLLNQMIKQMYLLDFSINNSLQAVEENI